MNAKLKGLFKGLRYISSIFEEEKEPEIVIGLPTDVKHVAHIGWEGPSGGGGASSAAVESAPSWMKEFPASEGVTQSLPTNVGGSKEIPSSKGVTQPVPTNIGGTKNNHEILYDREDSGVKPSRSKSSSKDSGEMTTRSRSSSKDSGEMAKSSKRHPKELHENTHNTISPKKDKPRNSRRRSSKETSENGSSSNKQLQVQDATLGAASSPPTNMTDVPRRHRRKKSKENQLDADSMGYGSGRSSRSKGKRQGGDHHGLDDRQSSLNSVVSSDRQSSLSSVVSNDRQSSLNSVVSNDSPSRTFGKEDKGYRPVL